MCVRCGKELAMTPGQREAIVYTTKTGTGEVGGAGAGGPGSHRTKKEQKARRAAKLRYLNRQTLSKQTNVI